MGHNAMNDFPSAEAFADLLSGNRKEPIWLPVLSGSMGPLLIPGDKVLIRPCTWRNCRMGDLIVFRRGMSLMVHRILFIKKIFRKVLVFQKGDAMDRGGFIPSESIVGSCLLRKRNGKDRPLDNIKENRKAARRIKIQIIKYIGKEIIKWILRKIRIFH